MDPAQLGVWVAHQIATHCEPALEADDARGRDKRYLVHRREQDGTLHGRFVLSAEDSEALLTALEPLARKDGLEDRRTAGQRRADALVDVCEQVLRHGALPDAGGLRPQLSYVLPADWAAAQQARASCPSCGPRCADHQALRFGDAVAAALPGQGGIRAEQACATGAWSGDLIRERTVAGLAAARARGRTGGRPTVWTADKLRTARVMRDSGDYDVASIARVLGVSRASVYRALDLPSVADDGPPAA